MERPVRAVVVALLFALALLLRLDGLDHRPLWIDEVKMLYRASANGPAGVLARIAVDYQAPLYDLFMWGVARIFTLTEWVARFPAALFGALLVPVAHGLTTAVFRRPLAGLFAAGWVACAPYLLRYGQEARPYALLALLSGLVLWAAVRVVRTSGESGTALLGAASVLLIWTHYYGVLLMAAVGVYLVLAAGAFRERLPGVAWAMLVPVLAGLLWAPIALYQFTDKAEASLGVYAPMDLTTLLSAVDVLGMHGTIASEGAARPPPAGTTASLMVWLGRGLLALVLMTGVLGARFRRSVGSARSCARPAAACVVVALVLAATSAFVPESWLASLASDVFKQGRELDAPNLAYLESVRRVGFAGAASLLVLAALFAVAPRIARKGLVANSAVLLTLAMLLPPLLVLALDMFGTRTYAQRNLILLAAPVAALAGGGLARWMLVPRGLAAIGLVVVAMFGIRAAHDFNVRQPWRAVATFLERTEAEVIVHPRWLGPCVEYYTERPYYSLFGADSPDAVADWAQDRGRLVLVHDYDSRHDPGPVREALSASHREVRIERFGTVRCRVFEKR